MTVCGGRAEAASVPIMEMESPSWGLAMTVAERNIPSSGAKMKTLLGIFDCTWPCTGNQSAVMDVGVKAKVALGVVTWLRYNLAAVA